MPIRSFQTGREIQPDCSWQLCALYEVPPGHAVELVRNGAAERWLLVAGRGELSANGLARPVEAPAALPMTGSVRWLLKAPDRLILLRCSPETDTAQG